MENLKPNQFQRVGVGLRSTHYSLIEESIHNNHELQVGWFEALTENYLDTEGRPKKTLETIRTKYPVALHGVALSIGSEDGVDHKYLEKLHALSEEIHPFLISDHLCFSRNKTHSSHDLLPLSYHQKTYEIVCRNIDTVQSKLKHEIVLENISSYAQFLDSELSELQFLKKICASTGCGMLLDLNNLYVNSLNFNFSPEKELEKIDFTHVKQIHLGGHSDLGTFLFDTHSTSISDPVWKLLKSYRDQIIDVPILLEWDQDIPKWEDLMKEVEKCNFVLEKNS